MELKTQILHMENNWVRVKNACRTTVNKIHTDNVPSSKFKTDLLISEHSPVRLLKINWLWKNIKSWVSVHWSRHKWECFIGTQRTDRTGIDRDKEPQDTPVTFEGEANIQHLIDTWRKRLCYQASKDTRVLAEDFKVKVKKDDIEPEIADVLVPNCIYRCGCPEFEQCPQRFWDNFQDDHAKYDLTNIRTRYELYNDKFYRRKGYIQ